MKDIVLKCALDGQRASSVLCNTITLFECAYGCRFYLDNHPNYGGRMFLGAYRGTTRDNFFNYFNVDYNKLARLVDKTYGNGSSRRGKLATYIDGETFYLCGESIIVEWFIQFMTMCGENEASLRIKCELGGIDVDKVLGETPVKSVAYPGFISTELLDSLKNPNI